MSAPLTCPDSLHCSELRFWPQCSAAVVGRGTGSFTSVTRLTAAACRPAAHFIMPAVSGPLPDADTQPVPPRVGVQHRRRGGCRAALVDLLRDDRSAEPRRRAAPQPARAPLGCASAGRMSSVCLLTQHNVNAESCMVALQCGAVRFCGGIARKPRACLGGRSLRTGASADPSRVRFGRCRSRIRTGCRRPKARRRPCGRGARAARLGRCRSRSRTACRRSKARTRPCGRGARAARQGAAPRLPGAPRAAADGRRPGARSSGPNHPSRDASGDPGLCGGGLRRAGPNLRLEGPVGGGRRAGGRPRRLGTGD
jgi:hypothetical protein